jgi:hypothetical protein
MRSELLALLLAAATARAAAAWPFAPPAVRQAPDPAAPAVDQLAVSGNACGPAALLSAFRSGTPAWQRAADLPGASDREQLTLLIRRHGLVKSDHFADRIRWHPRRGVNVADLTDMANDLAAPRLLPRIDTEILFLEGRESPRDLLRRAHARIDASLRKGLPPIASLRRYARRHAPRGDALWLAIEGHFIVVTSVPGKLDREADSFDFDYIDPWGGRRRQGTLAVPDTAFQAAAPGREKPGPLAPSPCLLARCPQTHVGLAKIRPGEHSVVAFDALIGRF